MYLFDEKIPGDQRQILEGLRIHIRQIDVDVGQAAMRDDAILAPLLHHSHITFFTRGADSYQQSLFHAGYGLVYLTRKLPGQVMNWSRFEEKLRGGTFRRQRRRLRRSSSHRNAQGVLAAIA